MLLRRRSPHRDQLELRVTIDGEPGITFRTADEDVGRAAWLAAIAIDARTTHAELVRTAGPWCDRWRCEWSARGTFRDATEAHKANTERLLGELNREAMQGGALAFLAQDGSIWFEGPTGKHCLGDVSCNTEERVRAHWAVFTERVRVFAGHALANEPSAPTERQRFVARAHFDLLRAISEGAGHSLRSTPGVRPLLDAGIVREPALKDDGYDVAGFKRDGYDVVEVTPLGASVLALVRPECEGKPAHDQRVDGNTNRAAAIERASVNAGAHEEALARLRARGI